MMPPSSSFGWQRPPPRRRGGDRLGGLAGYPPERAGAPACAAYLTPGSRRISAAAARSASPGGMAPTSARDAKAERTEDIAG